MPSFTHCGDMETAGTLGWGMAMDKAAGLQSTGAPNRMQKAQKDFGKGT